MPKKPRPMHFFTPFLFSIAFDTCNSLETGKKKRSIKKKELWATKKMSSERRHPVHGPRQRSIALIMDVHEVQKCFFGIAHIVAICPTLII